MSGDHDLIVRIDERVTTLFSKLEGLEKQFTNHLKHHWAVDMILLTAIIGLIAKVLMK